MNKKRIEGEIILKDGDVIRIGNMVIKVHAPFTEAKTQLRAEPVNQIDLEPIPQPAPASEPEPIPIIPPEEEKPEKKSDWLPLALGIGSCLLILCIVILCIALGLYFILNT